MIAATQNSPTQTRSHQALPALRPTLINSTKSEIRYSINRVAKSKLGNSSRGSTNREAGHRPHEPADRSIKTRPQSNRTAAAAEGVRVGGSNYRSNTEIHLSVA